MAWKWCCVISRRVLTGCAASALAPWEPWDHRAVMKNHTQKGVHQSRHPGWGPRCGKEAIGDHWPGQATGWLRPHEWGQGTRAKDPSRSTHRFWGIMNCCFKPLSFGVACYTAINTESERGFSPFCNIFQGLVPGRLSWNPLTPEVLDFRVWQDPQVVSSAPRKLRELLGEQPLVLKGSEIL